MKKNNIKDLINEIIYNIDESIQNNDLYNDCISFLLKWIKYGLKKENYH